MVYVLRTPSGLRTYRHLDLWCAGQGQVLTYDGQRQVLGFPRLVPVWTFGQSEIAYVSNTKTVKQLTERCPQCFFEGGPLSTDLWWQGWEESIDGHGFGVYDIRDEDRSISQVGSGIIVSRVRSRLRATYAGRFGRADSVWWLYDMLCEGRAPKLLIVPVKDGETPAAAELRWRERRREEGSQVSSNV